MDRKFLYKLVDKNNNIISLNILTDKEAFDENIDWHDSFYYMKTSTSEIKKEIKKQESNLRLIKRSYDDTMLKLTNIEDMLLNYMDQTQGE